jgi:hypothetical protein
VRTISTRYYRKRLWKITWREVRTKHRLLRIVKHYERRQAIGEPWQLVRSIVAESQQATNEGRDNEKPIRHSVR